MTREEAIKFGKRVLSLSLFDETHEFCELAVKALEQQPCEDAISRSEAIRIASGYCHWTNIPDELAKLPSVSAEKTGRWEKIKSGDKAFPESIVCSRCGNENSYINEWNFNNEPLSKVFKTSKYCPNCGCHMVEPQESEDKE